MLSIAQQQALETLIGSTLSPDQVSAISACITESNRNDIEIANIINSGRTKLVSKDIGKGDVIDTIGFEVGNLLLDAIDSNTIFRHVKGKLENDALDISRPLVRQAIDSMVGVIPGFTQNLADSLKNLALTSNPIQLINVSTVLNTAEGIPNG